MSYLIDTDVCSAWLKGNHLIWSRFQQYAAHLCVSTVSVAELFVWVYRSPISQQRRDQLLRMVSDLRVLEVSIEIAEKYGAVQAMLRASGKPAPSLDLLIAATALVHDATLVTHNVSDFANIPALQVEDWLTP